MKRIFSGNSAISGSYFRIVLMRSDRVMDDVGLWEWIKLTTLEFIFGEELLEQLTITAAYNESDKSKLGHLLHLRDMVPSGVLTNFFRPKIYQLLYYKFFRHYLLLEAEATLDPKEHETKDGNSLNLMRVRFGVRHELLYQVIALRRVYIVFWVALNILIDVSVWLLGDIQSALLSALSIEAIRRLLRV